MENNPGTGYSLFLLRGLSYVPIPDQKLVLSTFDFTHLKHYVGTCLDDHLEVDEPGLVRGDLVHRVDLEGDGWHVLAGVGLPTDVELVTVPQVRKESEELLQGVVQVWKSIDDL